MEQYFQENSVPREEQSQVNSSQANCFEFKTSELTSNNNTKVTKSIPRLNSGSTSSTFQNILLKKENLLFQI